ncbi:MAG: hypothetical protein ABIK15_07140 [Pseudomonadota bacterium]
MNMDVTTADKMEIMDPMTEEEQSRLEELENIVHENFGAFVETGMALAEIRDKKLYREEYVTFEAYCKAELEVSRSRAHRLIESATVVKNLLPIGQQIGIGILPTNERQARPLTKLPPEDQVKAWKEVLETCRKPTAHAVERVAKQYHNEEVKKQYRETKQRVSTESIVSPAFKKGFQAFMDVVAEERNQGWKKTAKKAAIKHIATIIKLIEQDD